eukprot:2734495-Rhodomonas_salina.1
MARDQLSQPEHTERHRTQVHTHSLSLSLSHTHHMRQAAQALSASALFPRPPALAPRASKEDTARL